jgi:hypothetical protein
MVKLFVAVPAYGCLINASCLSSLLSLRAAALSRGVEIIIEFMGNESLIPRGRNVFGAKFMKIHVDATHMLFLDSDIVFDAECVFKMLEFDKDVVCGIYAKKVIDWAKVKSAADAVKSGSMLSEPFHSIGVDYNINFDRRDVAIENGRFCKVLDAATGFMLINKRCMSKLYESFTSLYCVNDIPGSDIQDYVAVFDLMIDPQNRRYLSEDYAFCRRCQMVGCEIWADIASSFAHIGSCVMTK